MNQSIIADERTHQLSELCERYRLDILYAFGSRAREALDWMHGERESLSSSPSDLDIGVHTINGEQMYVSVTVDLMLELEDLFGVNRVDLVHLPQADAFLAANVIRGEKLFARDEIAADEYALYVLRRAGDLAPFKRQEIAMMLGAAA